MPFHFTLNFKRFGGGHLLLKNVLRDGVAPLGALKRSEPEARVGRYAAFDLGGVHVGYVKRNKKACVRVDVQ